MASTAHLIATKLDADVASLVYANAGRNLFVGVLPAHPDTAVVVLDTPGRQIDRAMKGGGTGIVCENHNVQVMVRHLDHEQGEALCRLIYGSIDNFSGSISGVRFLHIVAIHPPGALGEDETRRFRWSCNFTVRREF